MIKFENLGDQPEPQQKKMSSEEYIRFCEFCLKNNPHITAENCLARKTGEEEIKVPFHL
ncbi:MAG: hypothetical protein KAH99_02280 [Verrucomicrobia bacterium]|nr:hypothetical protein [Verrucomicrobiota bacterium]